MTQKLNNLLWVGTIVNTHGLKGELRILSNIDNPEEVFVVGNKIYYHNDKNEILELVITNMRKHKNFILLIFDGYNDINDIEWIKGKKVYSIKDELNNDEYYLSELIGKKIYNHGELIGEVTSYIDQGPYDSLIIKLLNGNSTNIPMVDEFEIKFNREKDIVSISVEKEILGDI